jgi:GTP-binding protein
LRTFRASLITVAPVARAFPPVGLPEIAVVGRSNAGKSTLINIIVGQKKLARVSGSPGKTRAIIFLDIEERFVLADLPGYGYARGPKQERATWRGLVGSYLGGDRPIKGVIALFDIRRKIDELDHALVSMLESNGLAWQAVWTKADKLKKAQVRKTCYALNNAIGAGVRGLPFSSKTRMGRDELLAWIEKKTDLSTPP